METILNNENKVSVSTGGVGFSGLLFLILMTLKLTGTIQISWGWVFASLLAGPALVLGTILAVGVVAGIVILTLWITDKVKS